MSSYYDYPKINNKYKLSKKHNFKDCEVLSINNLNCVHYYLNDNINKIIRKHIGSRVKVIFQLNRHPTAVDLYFEGLLNYVLSIFMEEMSSKSLGYTADCDYLSFNLYFNTREEGENLINNLRNNKFNFDTKIDDRNYMDYYGTKQKRLTKHIEKFKKYFINIRPHIQLIIEHHTYKDENHLNVLKKLQKNNKRKLKYLYVQEPVKFPYEVEIKKEKFTYSQGFRKDCIEILEGNIGQKNIDYKLTNSDELIGIDFLYYNSYRSFKFYTNSIENVNIAIMLFSDLEYKISKYITNENEIEE